MSNWQTILVIVWGAIALFIHLRGTSESGKKNAFGLTPHLLAYGVFVWGDAVIFGLFWFLVSIVILVIQDWILFLLLVSVFWVVRSLGESIYWLNQQFSSLNRNPPEKTRLYSYFHSDSVWFIHQIVWQCITVISVISTIYLSKKWF